MMNTSALLFFCLHLIISLANAEEPCAFAPECTCYQEFIEHKIAVYCGDVSTKFPVFNATFDQVYRMAISGNFTEIPQKAFYDLNSDISDLIFYRTGKDLLAKLDVATGAFLTNNRTISSISFNTYHGLTHVPQTFSEAKGLTTVQFFDCGVEAILNDTFVGVNLINLGIYDSHLREIEEDAFNGVENSLISLYLTDNKLEEVPEAIKSLNKVLDIYLDGNNITDVPADAFPPSVSRIALSSNPMLNIDINSFRNLTDLNYLELNSCGLKDVPTWSESLQSLRILQLRNNKITNIKNGDFPKEVFASFTEMPDLDVNPIESIEENAFDDLTSVSTAIFTNLYGLRTIDFNRFSHMKKLHAITFQDCRILDNVTVSMPENLPSELVVVTIDGSDLINHIDDNFGTWLQKSSKATLDLSDNALNCDEDLEWMSEYVFCSFHPQIKTEESTCHATRVPLQGYLSQFDINCE